MKRSAAWPAPPGFVHVDLDGLWTLAECYGFPEGESFQADPVFDLALPRLLEIFDRLGVTATFFVVGRDLEHSGKRHAVVEILSRGHALANHTYRHWIGLEEASGVAIEEEIERTQAALRELSGREPAGFRAPGYDAGPRVLAAAQAAGLRYDGSLLPTPWAPVLRLMVNRMRRKVRGEVEAPPGTIRFDNPGRQYGRGGGGRIRHAPHWTRPDLDEQPLLRLPLAVSPRLGLPLHASLGMQLGLGYVQTGLKRLAREGWPIAYLLHGMDALAPEEFADRLPRALARSRPFGVPLDERLDFIEAALRTMQALTRVQTTEAWLHDGHETDAA